MFCVDLLLAVLLLTVEEFEMLSKDERLVSSCDELILEFKLLVLIEGSD